MSRLTKFILFISVAFFSPSIYTETHDNTGFELAVRNAGEERKEVEMLLRYAQPSAPKRADATTANRATQLVKFAQKKADQTNQGGERADVKAFLLRNDSDQIKLEPGALKRPLAGPTDVPFGTERLGGTITEIRHTGITIRAEVGTPVSAAANGLVVFAQNYGWSGLSVIIDHGQNTHTIYGHLEETNVVAGDKIKRGDPVGTVGTSGSFDGAKLYFELRQNGVPKNPETFF